MGLWENGNKIKWLKKNEDLGKNITKSQIAKINDFKGLNIKEIKQMI